MCGFITTRSVCHKQGGMYSIFFIKLLILATQIITLLNYYLIITSVCATYCVGDIKCDILQLSI